VALVPAMGNAAVALAIGVFVAGVVQLVFQVPFLRRESQMPRPRLRVRPGSEDDRVGHESVGRMLRLMMPALFGTSVAQVNLLINTILASFLVTGSISWLYYADRLMEFPLGVFGIALGTAILPSLSEQHATRSRQSFSATLDWSLHWVALIAPAAAFALAVLSEPLMITLFQYGRFGPGDATMAARALVAFAAGLPAFVLIKVLAPGFYARQDTRTPVRAAVIAMVVNVVFAILLVFPLAHVGLALATSIAGAVNALVLFKILRREGVLSPGPDWPAFMSKIAVACVVMVMVLWYGAGEAGDWVRLGLFSRAWRLLFWVLTGMVAYGATILLLRINLRYLVYRNPATETTD
jgi:putative peptidoglycan lipid II flippase